MPPFRLVIPRVFFEEMLAHARTERPHECCGLLAGIVSEGLGRVQELHRLVNELASPTEFRSEPRSLFTATKVMRATGMEILAVYHSHPTSPPVPSPLDLERNYDESVVNLIVGLVTTPPEVRGWWLKEAGYEPAEFDVME